MFRWHAKFFASAGLASALIISGAAQGQDTGQTPPPGAQTAQLELLRLNQELDVQTKALAALVAQLRALEEQEKLSSSQRKSMVRIKKQLAAQERDLDEARRLLSSLQAGIDSAAPKAGAIMKSPAEPVPAQTVDQPPPQPAQKAAQTEPPDQPVGQRQQQPEQSAPPDVTAIFEQPGALTPRGKFVLEPSMQYSYSSTYRVALIGHTIVPSIHIGLIDIKGVNGTTWIAALSTRYGATNRLEFEFKLPYVYRYDTVVTRGTNDDAVFSTNGHGIGDVEIAARYQLNAINMDMPYYIAGFRVKARNGKDPFSVPYTTAVGTTGGLPSELPTGSGFVSLQPSLSIIYPTDPAVFFGGINYVKNIDRDVGEGRGMIHPGNAEGFNFGMGWALNEKTSFSIGIDATRVGRPTATGGNLQFPASTSTKLFTLLIGYSYRLSPNKSLNFSVGAGLTPDTPGLQLMLRIPIS